MPFATDFIVLGVVGSYMHSTQEQYSLAELIPGKVVQVSCGENFTLALVDVPPKQQD